MAEQGEMLDHRLKILSATIISKTNPYGETLTDLPALYNQRIAAVLNNPQSWENKTTYDDKGLNYVINSRGWNINIDYTDEGSFGFTPVDHLVLTRRDSGYSHNRMYYNYGYEPYYQIICKRAQDQNITNIKLHWDERNLMGYLALKAHSSEYYYEFMFQIERSKYELVDLLYRNTANWTSGSNFLIGYKHYSRPTTSWSPENISVSSADIFKNTYIKYFAGARYTWDIYENPHTDSTFSNISYYNGPALLSDTPHIVPPNIYNHTYNTNMNIHLNSSTYYNYNYLFFVEGREDDVFVDVTSLTHDNLTYRTILKGNETLTVTNVIEGDYIVKVMNDPNNYFKLIKVNDPPMIKGSITGTVTLKSCQVNPENLYVICLRSDGIKIGEYPVSSTNTYRIHNLNVNERYHIILVDKARTLEWMVSSYRKPLPYDDIIESDAIDIINAYVISDGILNILKWELDTSILENKYDYINIYCGNTIINNQLKRDTIIKTNGLSFDLTNSFYNDYKYYVIETVYKNKTKKSNIVTNNAVANITKFTSEYND